MRYPEGHKERTRRRILDAASRVFREQGYVGAGVDALMQEAGLTAGAFYAHFDSKEHLFTEVIREALEKNEAARERGLEELQGRDWVAGLLRRYMSEGHWAAIRDGCPIPTLISELPRTGPAPRRAFADSVRDLITRIETQFRGEDDARKTAVAALSLAVGTMALARAVGDEELAQEIINAGRTTGTERLLGATEQSTP